MLAINKEHTAHVEQGRQTGNLRRHPFAEPLASKLGKHDVLKGVVSLINSCFVVRDVVTYKQITANILR